MTRFRWRKSPYSESDQCVELHLDTDLGAIRDSKNPDGPVLAFPAEAVAEFVRRVKTGER